MRKKTTFKISFIFLVQLTIALSALTARANVIGTEYQNFNPTYSGLDFTTVHSSQTLKPCLCNLGLFFNYAKNTLTYSDQYYQTNTDLKGQRAKDYLVGADLNLGFGLSRNWDFGLSLPFVVTSQNDDPYGVSYFDKFGLTEVRPMTKFRFYGDDDGGLAFLLSGNFNTIENNPFAGVKPGPTLNLEIVGDTTLSGGTKLALNVGYRKRDSGEQITDPSTGLPPPFVPFKDSVIFSAALATHFDSINSDVVAELIGSRSNKINESDTSRQAQQALEFNLGLRNDWSKKLNLHAGFGTKLADAQASPDIRVYAGLNWNFGPICPVASDRNTEYPFAVLENPPRGTQMNTAISSPVTAQNIAGYRWKMGPTSETNCSREDGYSDEISSEVNLEADYSDMYDGNVTLCALAKNKKGVWQQLDRPSIYRWNKASPRPIAPVVQRQSPVAIVSNHPTGISEKTELEMPVSAVNMTDYESYRWKIGTTAEMNCYEEYGYSAEINGSLPLITTVKDIPDGGITLCAIAKDRSGAWQPLAAPTIVSWTKTTPKLEIIKKDGYELFRLSAEVLFDFDQDTLRPGAQKDLNRISNYLKQKKFKKVIIEGHTDNLGSDDYNMDLSERRAEQVMDWMIDEQGFAEQQLSAVGKGEAFPVSTNDTDQGRQKNRRVEFKIYR